MFYRAEQPPAKQHTTKQHQHEHTSCSAPQLVERVTKVGTLNRMAHLFTLSLVPCSVTQTRWQPASCCQSSIDGRASLIFPRRPFFLFLKLKKHSLWWSYWKIGRFSDYSLEALLANKSFVCNIQNKIFEPYSLSAYKCDTVNSSLNCLILWSIWSSIVWFLSSFPSC